MVYKWFIVFILPVLVSVLVSDAVPIAGVPEPSLARLDEEMRNIMETNNISAGSLSVAKDGIIVFHRVYGWQDRDRTIKLRPDALFRIASCTKPITAAAIRKLILNGDLALNSRVFSSTEADGGILALEPFGDPDPRISDITIDHLLKHRGGWDRDVVGDLTFRERTIADALGVESPPGRLDTVRYILGQPLQHNPGEVRAYSNIGYLVLGLVIEEVSGQTFRQYVQENVIGPSGSQPSSWVLGRTFSKDHDSREPFYDRPGLVANVFYPANSNEAQVEAPYGGWDFESRIAQGGIVTNGLVLLRFMQFFQVAGDGIGGPRPAPGSWAWNHTGSLAGTNSIMRQRGDGIDFVVIFNKRPESGTSYTVQMRNVLDNLFNSNEISSWPTTGVSDRKIPIPSIQLAPASETLKTTTSPGRFYQWQISDNLFDWIDFDLPFIGDGEDYVIEFLPPSEVAPKLFFRLIIKQ